MVMDVSFQYLMDMNTDMGVIFENGYGCEYNSTLPEPFPLLSLLFILANEPFTDYYASIKHS